MDIPTPTRRSTTIVLLVACLVFIAAGVAVVSGADPMLTDEQRLVVEDADTGDTLWSEPVTNGSEVAIEYTHSVHKSEVAERYEVDSDEDVLVADRMTFSTYGAGMPDNADVEWTDDGKFIYWTNGTHEELAIKPGSIAGHELVVDGDRHDLVEISNEKSVNIQTKNRSIVPVFADRLREAVKLEI